MKSLDNLYEAVADYDLVPDAPLASALNHRLDKPHFGLFVIPPRRLAADRREKAEDRTAFLELVAHSDLDRKRSTYAIGNILQCWEHQGQINSILKYDTYSPFSGQAFDQPSFRIFESTSAIVDTLVNSIAGNDPENVVVVLDQASEYSTVVESAFESAEIPFYGAPGFINVMALMVETYSLFSTYRNS